MKIKELTSYLESLAPLALQESYDNSGLLVGDPEMEISGVLVCLDSTEDVIDEAIRANCNLVLAHHPIIFGGIKKLNGKNYVERTVINAIRGNMAIYAIHTNLDNISSGVNQKIAEQIGLQEIRILQSKKGFLKKLVTFCPAGKAEEVRLSLFKTGSGKIGNYDSCSFNSAGTGTFRGNENSNPFVGKAGELHREPEIRIETIFESWKETAVLAALFETHPYEEVAYDIYPLENSYSGIGAGMIGNLPKGINSRDFLAQLKISMKTNCIRHTSLIYNDIQRIAVCGGSGSFLLADAIRQGAQLFITADFKYHQFFDADGKIIIADIGHYESEQFTPLLIRDLILKINPTFAVRISEVNTNPVNYS